MFEAIRTAPGSEEWVCLHSVGIAGHSRKAYAEADVVLICPAGVFCLEVKGGGVVRRDGVWTIGGPGRSYVSREGPFKQAHSAMQALAGELRRRTSGALKRRVPLGWGVAFPDIRFDQRDPEWHADCVYDSRDREHGFDRFIHRLARLTREREVAAGRHYPDRCSPADLRAVVECFRGDFDLIPSVADLVRGSHRELLSLSDQQYRVLDYALDAANPRTLCPGGAGTGKTLLAIEASKRFADQGARVLVLCFNRVLADHLRAQIPEARVTVESLYRFMRSVIKKAGMLGELEVLRETTDENELYRRHFPSLFEEAVLTALDELAPFDVLVVDEGQDILFSPVIDALDCVLAGGLADGRWLVFYDPELQAELYARMDPTVIETLRTHRPAFLPLTENFRNPRGIIDEMCALTNLEPPVCRREFQSSVEYLTFDSPRKEGARLRSLLVRLLRDRVAPSSITIVAGCALELCCASRYPPDVGKPITFLRSPQVPEVHGDTITASTVSSFKGLENDVIVMTDLGNPFTEDCWDRSVAYVGMTRARTKLFAVVPQGFVDLRFKE